MLALDVFSLSSKHTLLLSIFRISRLNTVSKIRSKAAVSSQRLMLIAADCSVILQIAFCIIFL